MLYSFSTSKGVFAGISFNGAVLFPDADRNRAYYGPIRDGERNRKTERCEESVRPIPSEKPWLDGKSAFLLAVAPSSTARASGVNRNKTP